MKLSLTWLRDYVSIPSKTKEELIHDITLHVAELEGVVDMKEAHNGVVVGEVLEVKKHPNADKLNVTRVNVGKEHGGEVQIVCGAPNVAAGQKVPVATIGTVLFDGQLTIAKAKMRGEESCGMICAEDEIGLGEGHDGIMVLDDSFVVGTPVSEALQREDIVLDIDNKAITHRPDLWCHIGFAREFAAMYDLEMITEPAITLPTADVVDDYEIVIESDDCSRYVGMEVSGIEVGPSPAWMQQRLEACGVRAINNIVDITNYVMLEQGEPLHAFDAAKIDDKKIIVRNAANGEEITTLDDEDRVLRENYLVIADANKALAVAGVMGGANSQVNEETTTVFFEAATFAKKPIREARIGLGLQSEATNRFEKGLNPVIPGVAMNRVAELLKELCPAAHINSIQEAHGADAQEEIEAERLIVCSVAYLERISGVAMGRDTIASLLSKLGFGVAGDDELTVSVPYHRHTDISDKEDIAEELIRMYGLENLPAIAPVASLDAPKPNGKRNAEWQLRDIMLSLGVDDVHLYDFINEEMLEKCRLSSEGLMAVNNALTNDCTHMSPTLLPQLILCTERNLKYRSAVNIFRIGHIYTASTETMSFAASFAETKNDEPYYLAKAAVDGLMEQLHLPVTFRREEMDAAMYHPGRVAEIVCNGQEIGRVGELHPKIAKNLGIKTRIAQFEIDFEKLFTLMNPEIIHSDISPYQAVEQDLSVLVARDIEVAKLENAVKNASGIVQSASVFDIYMGEGIADDQKSVSLKFVLQSPKKTLEEADITTARDAIIAALGKIGAETRF